MRNRFKILGLLLHRVISFRYWWNFVPINNIIIHHKILVDIGTYNCVGFNRGLILVGEGKYQVDETIGGTNITMEDLMEGEAYLVDGDFYHVCDVDEDMEVFLR